MSADMIPVSVRGPTAGRASSLANRIRSHRAVHPPEEKRMDALRMSKRHGIMPRMMELFFNKTGGISNEDRCMVV